MTTINLLGGRYTLASLELTRERMECATPSELARFISLAEAEWRIASNKGLLQLAENVSEVLKELKAQRRINNNRDSLKNGIICG